MIEFRLASFTIKSRRYVDFRNAGYFGSGAFEQSDDLRTIYNNHMTGLFKQYEKFVDSGVDVEDARFVLPYSYYSNIVFSAGVRELRHILYSMIYGRGSKYPEIRDLAEQMVSQLKEVSEPAFSNIDKSEYYPENKDEGLSALISYKNKLMNIVVEGQTELTDYDPNAKDKIIRAALISQGIYDKGYILEVLNDDSLKKEIINILLNDARKRELEQGGFTFIINNISLAGLTHFARHRMKSPVIPNISHAIADNNFIIPPKIASDNKLREEYEQTFYHNKAIYDQYFKQELEGIYFNLSGNTLSLQTYMNYRELIATFFPLRTCNRAQWEIRDIAMQMLEQSRNVEPDIFNYVGPRCYGLGWCPEKSLTCGKSKEIKHKFNPSKE